MFEMGSGKVPAMPDIGRIVPEDSDYDMVKEKSVQDMVRFIYESVDVTIPKVWPCIETRLQNVSETGCTHSS